VRQHLIRPFLVARILKILAELDHELHENRYASLSLDMIPPAFFYGAANESSRPGVAHLVELPGIVACNGLYHAFDKSFAFDLFEYVFLRPPDD
jgi:hypothetical protein